MGIYGTWIWCSGFWTRCLALSAAVRPLTTRGAGTEGQLVESQSPWDQSRRSSPGPKALLRVWKSPHLTHCYLGFVPYLCSWPLVHLPESVRKACSSCSVPLAPSTEKTQHRAQYKRDDIIAVLLPRSLRWTLGKPIFPPVYCLLLKLAKGSFCDLWPAIHKTDPFITEEWIWNWKAIHWLLVQWYGLIVKPPNYSLLLLAVENIVLIKLFRVMCSSVSMNMKKKKT